MKQLLEIIEDAQNKLREMILAVYQERKKIEIEPYVRFLSLQYHLTKDVQKDMFLVASSSKLVRYRTLRDFLYNFGLEEEPHYLLAFKDLKDLGFSPLEVPLDVKLWKGYFSKVCDKEPFIRLGATSILETISYGLSDTVLNLLNDSSVSISKASRFLKIHLHTSPELNHGDQVLECIARSNLSKEDMNMLLIGAEEAKVVYLRMMHWIINGSYFISQSQNASSASQVL